ncbi:MAG: hypothetical protein ACR2RF_04165 [Geminicoccaceae bacterium]
MATAKEMEKRAPRGKARLEIESSGKTLSVKLDRVGFHRLIQTLEQLAETGEPQTFEKSGRGPAKSGSRAGQQNAHPQKLIFRITDE